MACYQQYAALKLQLYQAPYGQFSSRCKTNMSPVKHVGFEPRPDGKRDLSKPIVVPRGCATGLGWDSYIRGTVRKRDGSDDEAFQLQRLRCAKCVDGKLSTRPGGPDMLCERCEDPYGTRRVPFYMKEGVRLSVVEDRGSREGHHQGFKKIAGKDELSQPVMCTSKEAEKDDEGKGRNERPDIVVAEAGEDRIGSNCPQSPAIAKLGCGNNGIGGEAKPAASEVDDDASSRANVEVEKANNAIEMEQQKDCSKLVCGDVEILVKAELNLEETRVTRRFPINERLPYEDLIALLREVFMIQGDVGLKYKDGEDDWVTVNSELEVRELYRECVEQGL